MNREHYVILFAEARGHYDCVELHVSKRCGTTSMKPVG